jgi:hypothetical protein
MQAVAHSLSFAKKVGVPQSVGREYTEADARKKDKEDKHSERKEHKGGKK